ncbi:hypothetical protein ABGB18_25090 [Nonomuraea sp. B12E4]|uniref:hypothetical protein n=1 Tax=Nonomuraea sp. B12E4 TaxID=3153564 RepID=UPI00325D9ED2
MAVVLIAMALLTVVLLAWLACRDSPGGEQRRARGRRRPVRRLSEVRRGFPR